jgi:hypothetical protein
MLVQFRIIWFGNEHRIVIEKMDFLLVAHADVRMSAQKVMQRRRARLLRAGKNEVESLNFATLAAEHQRNVHRQACRGS